MTTPPPDATAATPKEKPPPERWVDAWIGENVRRVGLYLRHTVEFSWAPFEFMGRVKADAWDWDKTEKSEKLGEEGKIVSRNESQALRPDRFISWMAVFYLLLLSPFIYLVMGSKSQEAMVISIILKLFGFYVYTGFAAFIAHVLMTGLRFDLRFFSKTWAAVTYSSAGPAFWGMVLIWAYYLIVGSPPLFKLPSADPSYHCAWKSVFGYSATIKFVGEISAGVFSIYTALSLKALHDAGWIHSIIAALVTMVTLYFIFPIAMVSLVTLLLWDDTWFNCVCRPDFKAIDYCKALFL